MSEDRPIPAGTPPTDDADYSRTEPAHLHMSVRNYVVIFAILLVLLVATVLAAFLPHFGFLNILIAMAIAIVKATLVVLFFMHVKFSSRVTMIFVASSVLWLGILFVLTWQEYLSARLGTGLRGWHENPVMVTERRAAADPHKPAPTPPDAAHK